MARWALLSVLLAGSSWAGEITRLDHRGSLGLLVASGGLVRSTSGSTGDQGFSVPFDVGVTAAIIGDHIELLGAGRFFVGPRLGGALFAGIRATYGSENLKSFFEAQLAGHLAPNWTIGLRLGVGFQYDFTSIFGVYANLAAQAGGGAVLLLQGELLVGVQFRTYIFEP